MKGVVFNMSEVVVEKTARRSLKKYSTRANSSPWNPLSAPAPIQTRTSTNLVSKTIAKLDIPLPDALRGFGKFAFPKLT